jgi:hypothetical protein
MFLLIQTLGVFVLLVGGRGNGHAEFVKTLIEL